MCSNIICRRLYLFVLLLLPTSHRREFTAKLRSSANVELGGTPSPVPGPVCEWFQRTRHLKDSYKKLCQMWHKMWKDS